MQAGASTGARAAVVVGCVAVVDDAVVVVGGVVVEQSSLLGVESSDLGVVFAENIILVETMAVN